MACTLRGLPGAMGNSADDGGLAVMAEQRNPVPARKEPKRAHADQCGGHGIVADGIGEGTHEIVPVNTRQSRGGTVKTLALMMVYPSFPCKRAFIVAAS